MFRGLVSGGPLSDHQPGTWFVLVHQERTVTCCADPDGGLRVVGGRQPGNPDEATVEYGWVWGMWLCGDDLAAARIAHGARM